MLELNKLAFQTLYYFKILFPNDTCLYWAKQGLNINSS
ncbi:hypothetical protein J580_0063 [Acinetobacter sp. 1542444]|nr:hypothetical protein J580_0063 [Acinetobacter sp. 1542444]